MIYTQTQWLILFYFYCFAGWVWETLFVSIRKRQWINRGFLHGPWLPIYGTGAILILFATLPVAHSDLLVFLVGMVSATALEYVTGAVMERIFHMRYWDYSDAPLNVNGYICLKVSVAWGFFSLFLVRVLHPPIERVVCALSGWGLDAFGLLLSVLFSVDVTQSVQDALDLKALLIKLTDSNDLLDRLDAKADALAGKLENSSAKFKERLAEIDRVRMEGLAERQNRKREKELSQKTFLLEKLAEHRSRKSGILSFCKEKAAAVLEEANAQLCGAATEQETERLQRVIDSLTEFLDSVQKAEIEMGFRKDRDFQRAVSILNRNPSARSGRYHRAVSELKSLRPPRRTRKKDDKQ